MTQKLILFIFLFSSAPGFAQKLKFNPKEDHPYAFETEAIVFEQAIFKLALKSDVETTFSENNKSISVKLNRAQVKESSHVLDTRNLEKMGKKDSARIKTTMSEPFIFKPENGKLQLVSHTNVKYLDKIREVINAFGKYYNPEYNEFYKGIVLKKGHSWSVTGAESNKIMGAGNGSVAFHYTVRDINDKEVVVYGKGIAEEQQHTTNIAVKYVLDKETGIPLYTKLITYGDNDRCVLLISKAKDYQAPSALEEFMPIENTLLVKSYKRSNAFKPAEYSYKKRPLITDKDKLEQLIKQCTDSLKTSISWAKSMYYLSGFGDTGKNIRIVDSLLVGAYSKVNHIYFYNRDGFPVFELKQDRNVKYNTPLFIGPYYSNLYQKPLDITKIEVDMITFTPTKRKTISLTSDTNNSDYNFKISDSSVVMDLKKHMNIDYQSFRFFDREGNELTSKWIPNYKYGRIITDNEAFTQEVLEQVPGEKKETLYSVKFLVGNVSKVTFDILTDDLEFRHKKRIYTHPVLNKRFGS
ncbi:hypothetical protein ED312_21755 [Sinomicrobium pectinilyticum]|uniref:DUF3857 domain-containing protein n=1 Tax=Sinomicrobium pectinilyticum TaxID=1084421 RepID=A0A3N0DHS1_SINP1|nr:hypothetical protein [Sinomicrobium pectinilyticum]RNL75227.1 hypothetical protein ED312_21755 [Sinomicrobium pectinilyticum]